MIENVAGYKLFVTRYRKGIESKAKEKTLLVAGYSAKKAESIERGATKEKKPLHVIRYWVLENPEIGNCVGGCLRGTACLEVRLSV